MYSSIATSLFGPAAITVLSVKVMPIDPSAPVSIVSFWKTLSPRLAAIRLLFRTIPTSPETVFTCPIGFSCARDDDTAISDSASATNTAIE